MTIDSSKMPRPVILYVEDDELTRQSVTNRLQRRGFDVLPTESGEQALNLVAERQPELSAVLMDVELPGIDGLQTYSRLLENFPDLPVVICSGALSPDICSCISRLEIPKDCCLCKPCPFADILAVIRRVTASESPVSGRG